MSLYTNIKQLVIDSIVDCSWHKIEHIYYLLFVIIDLKIVDIKCTMMVGSNLRNMIYEIDLLLEIAKNKWIGFWKLKMTVGVYQSSRMLTKATKFMRNISDGMKTAISIY